MKELKELMDELGALDKEIVALYEKRMKISEKVAEYKIANGRKIFDKQREDEKIESVKALVSNDFNKHGIREVFLLLMSMSRKLQYQLLAKKGGTGSLPFQEVPAIEKEKVTVVYQGVEGAYSQAALKAFFPEDVKSFNVKQWRDALEVISEGMADYAVLPIENSTAGFVTQMYDLLMKYDHYIVGEQIIKIDHKLLGVPGTKLKDINRVYSHEQALAQCQEFLNTRPWKAIPMDNTAAAAQKIADEKDKTQVAIASEIAGSIFGLDVIAEDICENPWNSTRFIVVTNKRIFASDAKKISICFELPHKSGSLYSILSHFIYNNLNMTKIESRPVEGRNWEYRFFVDFEGNLKDSAVKSALRGINEEARNMKILGNY